MRNNPVKNIALEVLESTSEVLQKAISKYIPKKKPATALKAWPDFLDESRAFDMEYKLPCFVVQAYESQGITDRIKMYLPVKIKKILGLYGSELFPDCPNIPEYHRDNADIEGADYYWKEIGGYYWLDADIEDADKNILRLRIAFNYGDVDCVDGFWGAAWDRDTRELIANIITLAAMETIIEVIPEFNKRFTLHPETVPLHYYNSSSLIGNFQYKNNSQLEKLIHTAIILVYMNKEKNDEFWV